MMQVSDFSGDPQCLKWNFKNLKTLELHVTLKADRRGTVVQAGGNLGVFPKWLSARFRRVVTFEPDHENFSFLCQNVGTIPNIIKFQAALGYERKSVGIATINNWGRTHAGIRHVSGDGLVPTMRLDDLGLDDVDFIQLDTEGYELEAIKGAVETIQRCRPLIMAEVNKNATLNGWSSADVLAVLGDTYVLASQIGPDKIFAPREQISE